MTKLIIQIPCLNEEETLGTTLEALPRELDGIDEIEWLIIDDGSVDSTVEVAKKYGVDHIVKLPQHMGLARAFMAGLDAAIAADADIIVNTDADNQYDARDIPKLIEPVLDGRAEIVIGRRPISQIEHFSATKRFLQRLGSWTVRKVSGTEIPDAPSGFRAMSWKAAMQLNVFNAQTYTLETIIQAGQRNIPITSVDIRVNEDLRPSRLIKSIRSYVFQSITVIVRIFMLYRPMRFFLALGSIPFTLGFLLGLRWLALLLVFAEPGRTHLPSLVLAAILILVGVQIWVLGFVADLMAANRMLLEEVRLRLRLAERNRTKANTSSAQPIDAHELRDVKQPPTEATPGRQLKR